MTKGYRKLLFFVILLLSSFSSAVRSQNTTNDFFSQLIRGGDYEQIKSYLFSFEAITNDSLAILANKLQNSTRQPELQYLGRFAAAKSFCDNGNQLLARTILLSLLKEMETIHKSDHCVQLKHAALCTLFYLENKEGNYQEGLSYIAQYGNDLDQECFNFIYGVSIIELGDFKTGIEILKQELYKKAIPSAHSSIMYSDYCNNIGDGCIKFFLAGQKAAILDTAALYYNKAYQFMANKHLHEHQFAALLQLQQARILFLRGKFSEALTLYTEAESHFQFQQPLTLQAICNGKAECFSKLDQPGVTIQWCDSFLRSYERKPGTKENLLQVYQLLSLNYEKLNQEKQANQYLRLIFGEQSQLDSHRLAASGILHAMDLRKLKQQFQNQVEHRFTTNLLLASILFILVLAGCFFFLFPEAKKGQLAFVVNKQKT